MEGMAGKAVDDRRCARSLDDGVVESLQLALRLRLLPLFFFCITVWDYQNSG